MDAVEQPLVEHLIDLRNKKVTASLSGVFRSLFRGPPPFHQSTGSDHHEFVMIEPLDVIRLYTGIAASVSLGLPLPFIANQLWLFVRPALTEKERNAAVKFLPAISLSFICGLLFGYFVIFPTSYHFLIELGQLPSKEIDSFKSLPIRAFYLIFPIDILIL